MQYRRVYLLVLDGLGVGNAPDAEAYGDAGSDTLRSVCQAGAGITPGVAESWELPTLAALGLGRLYPGGLPGLPALAPCRAHHGRLTEVTAGKDTTAGHWEIAGVLRDQPAPVFPHGFPAVLVEEFCRRVGRGVIGNRPASGTVIIQELGQQHLATGKYILYTSGDSVFQLAAHEAVVPLEQLYTDCAVARGLLTGPLAVDRVIARPFTGDSTRGFKRTADRRDFALPPPAPTVLDVLSAHGLDVIAIGKVAEIFSGQGITATLEAHGNTQVMQRLDEAGANGGWAGLVFANLGDFDMLFGHRNNASGFAAALLEYDAWLGGWLAARQSDELVIITADHGNDPASPSYDHSREQVPVLLYSTAIAAQGGCALAPPPGLAHIAATLAAALGVDWHGGGIDLLSLPGGSA